MPLVFRYDDAIIRDLEDALVHIWEHIPVQCRECKRIKDLARALSRERVKELEAGQGQHGDACECRRCQCVRRGEDVGVC